MTSRTLRCIFFFCKKIAIFSLSLWIVATITFFLMRAIPGDPFTQDKALPEEILKAMQSHYGLDKPLIFQYFSYLKGLLTFDLGPSLKYPGRLVIDIIGEGFPLSCLLGLQALFFSLFFGLMLGSISAYYHGKWQDKLLLFATVLGLSIPSFLLATGLQYCFAMKLHMFPVARFTSFSHSVLPSLSLAALPTAFIARLTRSSMIEVLEQDYIVTARAKGLSPIKILISHVFRHTLLPITAYLGPLAASILTGGFAVEKIFGIPGLGQWFILSILNRDYTLIMGTALFYGAFLMACVWIMDIVANFLDPKSTAYGH
jgi:oligopeptide transport system permease protein